jgi:fused signal recognition particle receptor
MEELKKVKRVISGQMDTAPHEILLILDATTGQNAISQTHLLHQELTVTGLVLTKLDGTAKGGIVVGACQEFQIPIRFIGLGEGLDDLKEFDPEQFVAALF